MRTCPMLAVVQHVAAWNRGLPGGTSKNPLSNAGDPRDASPFPGSGSSPRERHGSPLQHACLENPTVREVWRATVRGVATSWTRLSMHTCGGGKLSAPTLIFHMDSPMKQEVRGCDRHLNYSPRREPSCVSVRLP